MLIMKAVIFPKILYGIVIYGNTHLNKIVLLDKLMKRLLRIALWLKSTDSISGSLENFGIFLASQWYVYQLLVLCKKIQEGHLNTIDLVLETKIRGGPYPLRQGDRQLWKIPILKNNYVRFQPATRIVRLLNYLETVGIQVFDHEEGRCQCSRKELKALVKSLNINECLNQM